MAQISIRPASGGNFFDQFDTSEGNAAQLIQRDQPAVNVARQPVAPSPRVWGDQEAINAGLYEGQPTQHAPQPSPSAANFFDQFDAPAPPRQTPNAAVAERFGEFEAPDRAARIEDALGQRALEMTRGPQLQPSAQMAYDLANLVPAASQGTTPHISNYGGKLISTETFEDDGGNILFRNPETGKLTTTDNSKHVALRDPADGVVKIFARSDDTNEGALLGVSRVLAPGLAAGAVTSRPAIPVAKSIQPRASDIFATAKEPYRAFRETASQIEIPAETAAGIVERIKGAISKQVPAHLADEVYKSVDYINQPGKTVEHLRDVKELIGHSFRSVDSRVRQAAGIANREIMKIISEVAPSAGRSLKEADAIHSAAKGVQELQRKSEIAGLRTGRAGYGGNATNSMRQVLSPIVQRAIEGKTTGFQPGEIQAMREIVEGTTLSNSLRTVGMASPSKGIIPTIGGVVTGATAGATVAGPAGAAAAFAIPAIGAASNKLAGILTGRQIEQLKELVAKRSPAYAQAVAKATERYERAQIELINNPSPAKFAAYVSASRALSSGLTRDGIPVASGELLKRVAGQPPAAAEEQEPAVGGGGR